ncbi:hypothetical protein TrVE_jg7687 [Triparma verrucosa]|uniref:Uncharacterized protein n=1 Tax=Triparma verrucosa TaxID=1606542 RepID=A0A9W7FA34_9STRA|nr:hypothetical protein TrVE_jg7687 [Triparma verrucosa]
MQDLDVEEAEYEEGLDEEHNEKIQDAASDVKAEFEEDADFEEDEGEENKFQDVDSDVEADFDEDDKRGNDKEENDDKFQDVDSDVEAEMEAEENVKEGNEKENKFQDVDSEVEADFDEDDKGGNDKEENDDNFQDVDSDVEAEMDAEENAKEDNEKEEDNQNVDSDIEAEKEQEPIGSDLSKEPEAESELVKNFESKGLEDIELKADTKLSALQCEKARDPILATPKEKETSLRMFNLAKTFQQKLDIVKNGFPTSLVPNNVAGKPHTDLNFRTCSKWFKHLDNKTG